MKIRRLTKKGNVTGTFSQLPSIAIVLGIAIVAFVVMSIVTQSLQDTARTDNGETATCNSTTGIYTGCGAVYNMSGQGLTLFSNIGSQFGLLGTITILGIIVGVLIMLFGGFGKGNIEFR